MILFIALLVVAALGIGGTVAALRNDGYRRTPTEHMRVPDRSSEPLINRDRMDQTPY